MTFLPIVERELRVAARRHSTFWVRLLLALAAMVVGFVLFVARALAPPPSLAKEIFTGLGTLALIYCLASGRRLTADCLSEEKREGTLGLLFLTDLKGYDVVLGKLVATSVSAFYGLLAIVPVLAIPLLLGGVTNGEFWRTVLVLVNTFLFSLAVGVFASVLSRDARQAIGVNLLLLLFLTAFPPAVAALITYFDPSHRMVHPLFFSCPAYSFFWCFDSHYRWVGQHFWISVAVTHALAWLLAAGASWIVPYSWQDRASARGESGWTGFWRTVAYGDPRKRATHRARLLAVNPFCWLASRAWFKPAGVWCFLGFAAAWWFYLHLGLRLNWWEESFSVTTLLLLNSVLKIWIGIEASQRLAEEQKLGTLELLLSTPLNEREILRGQFLALKRQFLMPLLVVIGVEFLFLFAVSRYSHLQFDERAEQLGIGQAGLLLLIFDIAALFWVALLAGLTAKSPNRASASAILRVLVVPWLIIAPIALIFGFWSATGAGPTIGWRFWLYLWFWLGVFTDIAFGLTAWWQVRNRFRELALRRFTLAKPAAP
jgi:ABC-type transport system involved in multi-copper enzyme maturation permease subunit